MFQHVQDWYNKDIQDPIPSNLSEWDRRCYVITEVSGHILDSFNARDGHGHRPLLRIGLHNEVLGASVSRSETTSDSPETWSISVGAEWFLTQDELLDGAADSDEKRLESNIRLWVANNHPYHDSKSLRWESTAIKMTRDLSKNYSLSSSVMMGTLGHELGHGVHQHQSMEAQVFKWARYAIAAGVVANGLVLVPLTLGYYRESLFSSLNSFQTAIHVSSTMQVISGGVTFFAVGKCLFASYQSRRQECQADEYLTTSVVGTQGAYTYYQRKHAADKHNLGLLWYPKEAFLRVASTHPTDYQRMTFFKQKLNYYGI